MKDELNVKEEFEAPVGVGRVIVEDSERVILDDDLVQWVDDALASLKIESNIFDDGRGSHLANHRVQELYLLLRECMLSQRWESATKVLLVLVRESSGRDQLTETIHWVASVIRYQTECQREGESLLRLLTTRDIRCFNGVDYLNIIHERVLQLLAQSKLEEIKQLKRSTQTALVNYSVLHSKSETEHWDDLMSAYQGIIYYLEWKTSKAEYEQSQSILAANPTHLVESFVGGQAVVDRHAAKALECFSGINKKPGVFDVFLPAQIEMYIESEEKNKAVQLLEDCITINPKNTWAKQKLIDLYGVEYPEKKLELLKDICTHDISHPLAVKLYKKLQSKGEDCIYILFDLLDHPTQMNELKPWKLLSDQLLLWGRMKLQHHVSGPWHSDRITWWPQYHFTRYNLRRSCPEVLECKLVTAYLLLDKESSHRTILDSIVQENGLESEQINNAKE